MRNVTDCDTVHINMAARASGALQQQFSSESKELVGCVHTLEEPQAVCGWRGRLCGIAKRAARALKSGHRTPRHTRVYASRTMEPT